MMPDHTRLIRSSSPEATAILAARFGASLRAGDVVLLSGPVGAGKSHFARAVIQSRLASLGRIEDVPSPTFTLVQTYDLGQVDLWHADLYRLSDPDEILELGLDQAFEEAICLVEWPERLGSLVPRGALHLTLIPADDPDERDLLFSSDTARWDDCVATLAANQTSEETRHVQR
ncbi:MAG: tRNA (adenosine(37)-N6)-threonylcarbamoyltransferase complex ATPase subunit type 1 TsaE [Roseinatronobacter sp.]